VEEKTQIVLKDLPDLSQAAVDQALFPLVKTYLTNVQTESQEVLLEEVTRAIETSISQTEPQQRRFFILQQIQQIELGERLRRLRQAEHQSSVEADEVIDRQLAVLEAAEHFLDIVNDDMASIECPACGRTIQTLEFTEHVHGELQRLEAAQASRRAVIQRRGDLQKGILELRKWLKNQDFRDWLEGAEQEAQRSDHQLVDLNLE
jgi:hypothetical protein